MSNKKLRYQKFNNMNDVITIDLHNDYEVIALIGRDNNGDYDVQLMLNQFMINNWTLIEEAEHLYFQGNSNNIYSAILKKVDAFLQDNILDYYINRYKYELECFDKGNELFESERKRTENFISEWDYEDDLK